MKKLSALLLFLLPLNICFADAIKIKVEEKNENIGGGKHNALVVSIFDAKQEDIEKEWKSKMRGYDAKVSGKDEIFADNALIKAMGENTMDIYARVEKVSDNECRLIVGFDLGGAWLSSSQHSNQFKEAKKIVEDFARKLTKDAIDDKRKDEEKKLSKLKDEQSDLEKKNADLKKDIEDYKAKIAKAEEDIKKNEESQAAKKKEIEEQQKKADDVKKRLDAVE
ncbi:MAG: hypothetical protein Fur0041_13510 [Bacteroidia bacterium]